MLALAIGACDVDAVLERGIGDHRDARTNRADEPGRGSEPFPDLFLARRPECGSEHVLELDLVQAVVAAHEREREVAVLLHDRQRLDDRWRLDPEQGADLLDRARVRRRDRLRRR